MNKLLRACLAVAFVLYSVSLFAQIERVEPPYWWVGMKEQKLELLIYGKNIGGCDVSIDHTGVSLQDIKRVSNPNYLFLELGISNSAIEGLVELEFTSPGQKFSHTYQLKAHNDMANGAQGIGPEDLVYLIFPDRFANGDPSNDIWSEAKETELDRTHIFKRHGGDLQGVVEHLPYLQDLGVTALWLNPVWTNDQPTTSYHGYAPTDLYHVDPRLGGDSVYSELIKECHERGMKVIKDIVYNHWGDQHWIYQDLPDSSWFHFWPEFTKTSFKAPTLFDPHGDPGEKTRMTDGWFDHHMPDLNQTNPELAQYLIQHSIWWVGHFGVDAFRIDTYAYPDQAFMAELNRRMQEEFPDFFSFGETWVHGTPVQAWFTGNNKLTDDFNSGLSSVTDFQLYYAMTNAFHEDFGWTEGVSRFYYTLAKDVIYERPNELVTFLDNHDLSRIYSVLGEDPAKLKLAIGLLLTTRGIPCLYYGTEIALKNFADPDGKVRQDFPGGWNEDQVSKFTPRGRNQLERDIFLFTSALANYRKDNPELFKGELIQFLPQQGVYAYLRKAGEKRLLVIMNTSTEFRNFDWAGISSVEGLRGGLSVFGKERFTFMAGILNVPPMEIKVYELF